MGFDRGHALVIGVGSYQFAPYIDVPIAVEDAKSVTKILANENICAYPQSQVRLLQDNAATKEGILTAINGLAGQVKEQDTVFLFYCGHGALGLDGNYYLVSHDARIENGRVVPDTGVKEIELLEQLRAIKAERVLTIFNSCFSGRLSPSLSLDSLASSGLPEDTSTALLGTGKGRIIITACREDQESYIGDGELTIFTQALLDGLKGRGVGNNNGFISAYSLYEHIFETVSEAVSGKFNIAQEPELTVLKGVGPFAVALYKGASALGAFDENRPIDAHPGIRQVEEEKAMKVLGNYIGGDLTAGAGSQVHIAGRDNNIIEGNQFNIGKIEAQQVMQGGEQHIERLEIDMSERNYQGDHYEMSGDFRGAILNIKNRMEHVSQSIGALPYGDASTKKELTSLIEALKTQLEKAPPDRIQDAEKVSKYVQSLTEELEEETPDKELVEKQGNRLKRAAEDIEDALPTVIVIATKIIKAALAIVV